MSNNILVGTYFKTSSIFLNFFIYYLLTLSLLDFLTDDELLTTY